MPHQRYIPALLISSAFLVSGCIDMESSRKTPSVPPETGSPEPSAPTTPPASAAALSLSGAGAKTLQFTWTDVDGADHYRLLGNPDGSSGYSQIGSDIPAGTGTASITVPVFDRVDAEYILESCNDIGCAQSDPAFATSGLADAIGYFKSVNPTDFSFMAYSLALSDDGTTFAFGEPYTPNSSSGINGDRNNVSGSSVGAVHVVTKNGSSWDYDYIKADFPDNNDYFGESIDLSDDGNILVVGASGEDSISSRNPMDNSENDSGAVYVFERSGGSWSQKDYLKASNLGNGDSFGRRVAVSGDGDTIIVGADWEDSSSQGIDGAQDDGSSNSGAAYVFRESGGYYLEEAFFKSHNSQAGDRFGSDVDISDDGNTAIVSAFNEDSFVTGVNTTAEMGDSGAADSGAVYLFTRSGSTWTQDLFIKASNTDAGDKFGTAISISGDGRTLVAGAPEEQSSETGINGLGFDNSGTLRGAAYVFSDLSGSWQQEAYVKASVSGDADQFGAYVTLSDDGNVLVVGAEYEDGPSAGFNGDQNSDGGSESGAAYVFKRDTGSWSETEYLKAPNADNNDNFGGGVSLSGDGQSLLISAPGESGGIAYDGGDQSDNSSNTSGAIYLY